MGVKPEPVEPEVPHKRPSDIAFGSGLGIEDHNSAFQALPWTKQRKAQPTLKAPLAILDRNTGLSESAVSPSDSPAMSVQETRAKLLDVQSRISNLEVALHRLSCKRSKSNADLTRMKNYSQSVQHLRQLKDDLSSSLPNMSLGMKTPSRPQVKPEPSSTSVDLPPSYSLLRPPVASGSNVQLPAGLGSHAMDARGNTLPADLSQRVNHVIPTLPHLPGADHFDDNGDFHGRGRDLFVGPQAKADE